MPCNEPRETCQCNNPLPSEEQDAKDAVRLADEYLILRRCRHCRRLNVRGMSCSFCDSIDP